MPERPKSHGRRKLNKFSITRPNDEALDKYLKYYTGKDLWFHSGELVPITSKSIFGNDRPLGLDIGCGRGEYVTALARLYPSVNYVGIDVHTKSLWDGLNKASAEQLQNVKFIRAAIKSLMTIIPDDSVEEVHIMFPPPVLVRKHIKKDIITPDFVMDLHRIIVSEGRLNLVTDHEEYFYLKLGLIRESGLFILDSTAKMFEGGVTWYQRVWERHGFATLRALLINT